MMDSLTALFLLGLLGLLLLFLLLVGIVRGKRSLNVDFKIFGAELKINAAAPGVTTESATDANLQN